MITGGKYMGCNRIFAIIFTGDWCIGQKKDIFDTMVTGKTKIFLAGILSDYRELIKTHYQK